MSDLPAWIIANVQASYGLDGARHLIQSHLADINQGEYMSRDVTT